VKDSSKGVEFRVELDLSNREKELLRAGGKLTAIRAKHKGK
jgi:hypothetical protein